MVSGKQEIIFDTSGLQELIFEDIRDISVHNGIFRATLYSYRVIPPSPEPVWVPVVSIATPLNMLRMLREKVDTRIAEIRTPDDPESKALALVH